MPIPNISYSDMRWYGIDAYHSPGKMGQGFLQAADNCLLMGGDLVSRPGRQGLLTAPHGSPTYVLGAFRRADGTTALTYTSGGKLYRLDKGASASVEIKDAGGTSLSLISKNAFAARLGKYQFIVDGAGSLIRTDLSTGVASPFLSAPAPAATAALTSTPIDSLLGLWTPDFITGAGQANRLPNADFSAFANVGGHDIPNGWDVFSGDPDLYGTGHAFPGPDGYGESGAWLLLDNPGEGLLLHTALANDTNASDPLRYATQFYGAITLFQSDPTGAASVKLGLVAYSDAGGTSPLTELTHEFTLPFTGNAGHVTLDTVFSLAALPVPALSYRVRIYGGVNNSGASPGNSVFCRQPVCFPFTPTVTAATTGTMIEVQQLQQLSYTGGTLAQSNAGTVGYGKGAGGLHLTRDYGAAQDWSKYSAVALSLGKASGITGLTLSLAFRQAGSATRYYTNAFTVSADGTVATCDISTVSASVRASFRYLEIILGGDFTVPAASGTDLLLFGPLTGAGNLSIGYADYSYVFTEVDAGADPSALADVLESNPSPVSGSVTPTGVQAEASVFLPARTNAGAGYAAVYRFGGVFSDAPAVGRLIAVLPFGSDFAFGSDTRNPYYSWNHTTRTLIDNTPDSYVIQPGVFPVTGTPLVPGRDVPPSGAQAICAYHGRLILAVGSVLWVSWLVTPTNPSALYFTATQVPGDPNEAIKGASFPIGGRFDNDPIQALVPHNTDVVIEKHTAKSLLQGYSGENFAVTDYLQGAGFGCVAPRTALLMGNSESCLCASGPFRFNGAAADEFGLMVENLIRPRGYGGEATVSPSALAGAAAVYHDRRYLLSCPAPGGSTNALTYVYDTRQEGSAPGAGWTRFTFGFTSAVTTSSGTDSDDAYFGADDGQVYTLAGSADLSTPGGAASPIACAVTSRGFGMDAGEFWREDDPQRLYSQVGAPAGTVLSRRTDSDYAGRYFVAPPWTLSLPYEQADERIPGGLSGHWISVTHSWAASGPVRLYGSRLTSAPRGPVTD